MINIIEKLLLYTLFYYNELFTIWINLSLLMQKMFVLIVNSIVRL